MFFGLYSLHLHSGGLYSEGILCHINKISILGKTKVSLISFKSVHISFSRVNIDITTCLSKVKGLELQVDSYHISRGRIFGGLYSEGNLCY